MAKKSVFCNKIGNFAKNFGQFFVFRIGKTTQDKIRIANAAAEGVVGGADPESWEILRAKVLYGGLEAVCS